MQEISREIDKLKESPLFNLSLASKELFHSNFLAWLFERKDEAAPLFQSIIPGIQPLFDADFSVQREKDNLDLVVWFKDIDGGEYRIVVENKVKSIPAAEQLDKYSAKLARENHADKTVAVLLSLTPPDFFEDSKYQPEAGPEWRFVDYELLRKSLAEVRLKNNYHALLLEDYVGFIQELINLQTSISELFDNNEKALLNPFEWPAKGDISLYQTLKKIRMHDVFEKWRMCHLKDRLEERFRDRLDFEIGFSRGTGMLNILTKNREGKLSYRVCLQANQMKQVLVRPDGVNLDIFEKAKKDLEAGKWFLDKHNNHLPERGKEEHNYFCCYGDKFAYRYENVSDSGRLVQIAEALLKME